MKVAFRVDASTQMGSGHVMRCAALAGLLRRRDAEIAFICREHEGNYCDWIEAQGYTLFRLPAPASDEATDRRLPHSKWLGVTQARDGEETRRMFADATWDWLIVDHYGLDAEWEEQMRPALGRIMVIDDLADRRHDADLLLDQNIQARPGRYDGLVPDICRQLLGPNFALLRSEFSQLRADSRPRDGELNRLLVFMGGSDQQNLTSKVLDGVRQSGLAVHTDVVMGGASVHLDNVRQQCSAAPACALHVQTGKMAHLMAGSDLMIGAPGSATWERCCLGLPSLLIAIAENQRELGIQVARRHAAILLGQAENISADSIAGMLKRLATRPSLLRAIGRRAGRIVDGIGGMRVAANLSGQ